MNRKHCLHGSGYAHLKLRCLQCMLYIAHLSDLKRVNAAVCVVTYTALYGCQRWCKTHTDHSHAPGHGAGVHSGECVARADTWTGLQTLDWQWDEHRSRKSWHCSSALGTCRKDDAIKPLWKKEHMIEVFLSRHSTRQAIKWWEVPLNCLYH